MGVQRQTFNWKLYGGLFIAALVLHILFLYVFVVPTKPKADPPSVEIAGEKNTPLQPEKSEKTQEKAPQKVQPKTPVSKTLYRVPSRSSGFGRPLNFKTVRQLPRKLSVAETRARAGIIVDLDTRKVLWQKNAHKPVPVASMSKMLTLLLVMEEMDRNPELSLSTPVKITDAAVKVKRDGVIGLKKGDVYPLGELIQAALIRSSNDAAEQLAEVISGSVPHFVARMNGRVQELGIKGATFINPCGLPDAKRNNSRCSVSGMILIGEKLLEYPIIMRWAKTRRVVLHDGKELISHNHLLVPKPYPGVDGLKTGFTRAAGSCLTFSVLRNGRRMMGCVAGFGSAADRDNFCRQLIDWAYSLK